MKNKHYSDIKIPKRNSILRLILCGLSIVIQIAWVVLYFTRLDEHFEWIASITRIVSFILALWIYSRNINSAGKITWIVFILLFPVLGILMYFIIGNAKSTSKMQKKYDCIDQKLLLCSPQNQPLIADVAEHDKYASNIMYYINTYAGFSIYRGNEITYYPDTKDILDAKLTAMQNAKRFIFMEYFAIEDAVVFGQIKDILAQKAKEGVDIRILYDEVGSVSYLSRNFIKQMGQLGISCRIFNPMTWFVNTFLNNRDHRKITVIDNEVAFTGGYNIADEYFNIVQPFGHWKDNGICIRGDAAQSLTSMFLEMWHSMRFKTGQSLEKDISSYLSDKCTTDNSKADNYVVPYSDSPMDEEHTGENVYMNIINSASDYVYFITPYLIITDELSRMLGLAAKRGVDVRLITPGIPDKKVIYQCTRSFYAMLVRRGVRIYEYTPGFCHAKTCICDDKMAVIGSINLDYRSLYHHFENGVFLYNDKCLTDIKEDFYRTFTQCKEVTDKYKRENRHLLVRIAQAIIRLIAPLL